MKMYNQGERIYHLTGVGAGEVGADGIPVPGPAASSSNDGLNLACSAGARGNNAPAKTPSLHSSREEVLGEPSTAVGGGKGRDTDSDYLPSDTSPERESIASNTRGGKRERLRGKGRKTRAMTREEESAERERERKTALRSTTRASQKAARQESMGRVLKVHLKRLELSSEEEKEEEMALLHTQELITEPLGGKEKERDKEERETRRERRDGTEEREKEREKDGDSRERVNRDRNRSRSPYRTLIPLKRRNEGETPNLPGSSQQEIGEEWEKESWRSSTTEVQSSEDERSKSGGEWVLRERSEKRGRPPNNPAHKGMFTQARIAERKRIAQDRKLTIQAEEIRDPTDKAVGPRADKARHREQELFRSYMGHSTAEVTSTAIDAVEEIKKVAQRSKHLKGAFVGNLWRAAECLTAVHLTLSQRAQVAGGAEVERVLLEGDLQRRELATLRADVKLLRGQLEAAHAQVAILSQRMTELSSGGTQKEDKQEGKEEDEGRRRGRERPTYVETSTSSDEEMLLVGPVSLTPTELEEEIGRRARLEVARDLAEGTMPATFRPALKGVQALIPEAVRREATVPSDPPLWKKV